MQMQPEQNRLYSYGMFDVVGVVAIQGLALA